MSGLDEIEQLCRIVYERNMSVKFGDPRYTCSVNSQELRTLLEAMLAVLPVVKAAEAYEQAAKARPWSHEVEIARINTRYALLDAIDAMRAALAGDR